MNPRSGFGLIPWPARVAAAIIFAGAVFGSWWFFGRQSGMVVFGTLTGLMAGSFLAATVLLAGYVYADASQRGMPPIPWTALALLVPNGVGFVLYFLLRKPIVSPCPACGTELPQNAAFCYRCGRRQMPDAREGSAA
jgi:hypothetical protein